MKISILMISAASLVSGTYAMAQAKVEDPRCEAIFQNSENLHSFSMKQIDLQLSYSLYSQGWQTVITDDRRVLGDRMTSLSDSISAVYRNPAYRNPSPFDKITMDSTVTSLKRKNDDATERFMHAHSALALLGNKTSALWKALEELPKCERFEERAKLLTAATNDSIATKLISDSRRKRIDQQLMQSADSMLAVQKNVKDAVLLIRLAK